MPVALTRRAVLGGIGATSLSGCAHGLGVNAERPALAVTIDDFDIVDGPLLSAEQRHRAVLRALDRHHVLAHTAGAPQPGSRLVPG